jgi:hypothetical protein
LSFPPILSLPLLRPLHQSLLVLYILFRPLSA